MPTEAHHERRRDWVALILAIGFCTSLVLITIGVLLAAYFRGHKFGDYSLSENATQLISGTYGTTIGVLVHPRRPAITSIPLMPGNPRSSTTRSGG